MAVTPEACAALHNRLVDQVLQHVPGATRHRTLGEEFLAIASARGWVVDEVRQTALYEFLRLADTSESIPDNILAPRFLQPSPRDFWIDSPFVESNPLVVLLYPAQDSPFEGGVFFNMATNRAAWHMTPGHLPPEEEWVALDEILRSALSKWERGTFYWDTVSGMPMQRSWAASDVDDALSAWDGLLTEIESRRTVLGDTERLEPIPDEALQNKGISAFVCAFLSRAQRPAFTNVAPGISAFSPTSLVELYSSEPDDSKRRKLLRAQLADDPPSLLLPGDETVPDPLPAATAGQGAPNFFDREWGFGKFTLIRRTGIYTAVDEKNADTVCRVDMRGVTDVWLPRRTSRVEAARGPKLAEVLTYWRELITEGVWAVEEDGVVEA